MNPFAHLPCLSRKNHPAQSITGKDNPANSLDQRMNRRVSAFMLAHPHRLTRKQIRLNKQTDRPLHLCAVTAQSEKEQP